MFNVRLLAILFFIVFSLTVGILWSETGPPPLRLQFVTFDNYLHQGGMKTGWGFACVVQGLERTVLFDTGGIPGPHGGCGAPRTVLVYCAAREHC